MVFAGVKHEAGQSSTCLAGAGGSLGALSRSSALEVGHRTPLKRRGLSRFYSSKSQSFSCFQDLTDTPYGSSTIVLGKGAHTHLASVRRRLARRRPAAADTDSSGGCVSSSAPVSPSHSDTYSADDSMTALERTHSLSVSAEGSSEGCGWGRPSAAPCDDAGVATSLQRAPHAAATPIPLACVRGLTAPCSLGDVAGLTGAGRRGGPGRRAGPGPAHGEGLCLALQVVSLSAPTACELGGERALRMH